MADPTITKARKAGQNRRRIIATSETRLRSALKRLQRKLNAFIAKEVIGGLKVDADGKILNSANNAARLKGNERIRKQISNVIDKELRGVLNKEFKVIDNANKKYYKLFEPNAKLTKRANKQARKLALSFKRNVLNSMSFNRRLSAIINQGIKAGLTHQALKKDVREAVDGDDKLGIIENHFWRQDGFEQFQVHARAVSNTYAKGLNLDYAIYAGGEIKTTRDFCDERNGNVYSREEILSWNNEEWQGKKKNNRILIDCGGYNCRHEFDWISKQMAVRIRPDLG